MNIREKSGVGYLLGDSNAPTSSGSRSLLYALGLKVLDSLRAAPQGTARINELVDTTNVGRDQLQPVIESLQNEGLLKIAELDRYGNHVVKLTAKV